jgi:hypothetical protein
MKELFILGAGASFASAGMPLGKDLVWDFYLDCCTMSPIINGAADNRVENNQFINYIKFLEIIGAYYPDLKFMKRNFLSRGDSIFSNPYPFPKNYYIDDLLLRLLEVGEMESINLVRQLIFEHLAGKTTRVPNNELYKLFCEKKLTPKDIKNIAVISFNFDCLINEALDLNDGFSFDYMIGFDYHFDSQINTHVEARKIPLIKLNGSLDWGICQTCGKHTLISFYIRPESYDKNLCKNCNEPLTPNIVAPHEQYPNKFDGLYEVTERIINEASKITIIGYSFPDYDQKIINIFSKTLRSDSTIFVVDHCNLTDGRKVRCERDIKTKYKHLFPQVEKIKILLSGFEGYLNE